MELQRETTPFSVAENRGTSRWFKMMAAEGLCGKGLLRLRFESNMVTDFDYSVKELEEK